MGVDESSGQRKYKCRNGHYLSYTTNGAGYLNEMFSCDNCKQSRNCSEGRYNCSSCQWDLCNFCSDQYKPRPNPITQCKSGHPLTYTALKYEGSYGCDLCGRLFPSTEIRWCCTICQYDICPFCRPSNPMPPPYNPNPSICPSGHPLDQTGSADGYYGETYSCNICHQARSFGDGLRWNCSICKYDICPICKPS